MTLRPAEEVTQGHCQGRRALGLPNVEMFGCGAAGSARQEEDRQKGQELSPTVTRPGRTRGTATPRLPRPHYIFPNKSDGTCVLSLQRESKPNEQGRDLDDSLPFVQLTCSVTREAFSPRRLSTPWVQSRWGADPSCFSPSLLGWGRAPEPSSILSSSSSSRQGTACQLQKEWWVLGAARETSWPSSQPHTRGGQDCRVCVGVQSTFDLWPQERTACTASLSLPATKNAQ